MKNKIRTEAKELRKTLDTETLSKKITENILSWDVYKKSQNIMIFYPLKYEVNLLELLNDTTKQFFLPKMNGETLSICEFNKNIELKKEKFNILEPEKTCDEQIKNLDIVFLPALATDKSGNRLGYGKGFYDRFLKDLNIKTIKVIPIYEKLMRDKIPTDKNDVKTDYIITEHGIFEKK